MADNKKDKTKEESKPKKEESLSPFDKAIKKTLDYKVKKSKNDKK